MKNNDNSSDEIASLCFDENSSKHGIVKYLDGVHDSWDNESDNEGENNFDVKKNANMKTYEPRRGELFILLFCLVKDWFKLSIFVIANYGLRNRSTLKQRSNLVAVKSDDKQDDYEMTEEEQTKRAIEESLASYKLDNPDVI